ncbi:MAG TPA: hypothetical protein VLE49_09465 [Anaerolineales bacterium]|nr:hypothetical protein [Anaerolineales bacterium]
MKLKIILVSLVILTGLFLSAFGSPAAPQPVKLQATATVVPPAVTVVVPTVVVQTTPGAVPVTGGTTPTIWTIVLFGLLGLLALAFLVALFSPRIANDHIDRNPPPPPEV